MAIFDLKSIANVLREAGKIEQYQQILDLLEERLEMQKRNAELESENKNLKEKLKIKEALIHENNAYWINENGKKDGPFCSRCWDKNKDLIRMHPFGGNSICPECETAIGGGTHENFIQQRWDRVTGY